jgi:hypothetical protein
MSKHGSARTLLAGAAIITLAGCGVPSATVPDVPHEVTGSASAGANSLASGAAAVNGARQGTTAVNGARQNETSRSFAKADSIPFPVAVGNTWAYRTTANGETGRMTNRIVSAGPVRAGYQVTMSSASDLAGTATAVRSVYLFYPDGTIGFPVPRINGVSVAGGGIRWPDAAGLASGRAYRSVLRIQVSQTGRYENANVIVRGEGTTSIRVPAGTYQTSVVDMTIAAKVGGSTTTIEVATWIAEGTGPVQTAVLIQAAGKTELTATNVLLAFTKGPTGIGS